MPARITRAGRSGSVMIAPLSHRHNFALGIRFLWMERAGVIGLPREAHTGEIEADENIVDMAADLALFAPVPSRG